jgi:hypothetical protein
MTNEDWGDIESVPKRKGAFPPWLWFCGSGCIIVVLLLVGLLALGVRFVDRGSDSERQWPRLEKVLPFEQRSEEFELKFGWQVFGTEGYTFFEKDGDLFAQLLLVSDDDEDVAVEIKSSGAGDHEDVVLIIQGRELQAARLDGNSEAHGPWWGPQNEGAASLLVDLTEEGSEQSLMLIMARQDTSDPITKGDVARFLAPFHVGPDRIPLEEFMEQEEERVEEERLEEVDDGPR